jgi:Mg2+-importing ATPase
MTAITAPLVGPREEPEQRKGTRWAAWIVSLAALAAVIGVVLHFSEHRDFLQIAQRAEPRWLLAALLLQAGTYLAQGQVWRIVHRAARVPLPLRNAYTLSLVKLFLDQALPSAGISGTVVVARALEERGAPRPVVMAAILVDSASYYLTYILCLGVGLLIASLHRQTSPLVLIVATCFILFAAGMATVALTLSGPRANRLTRKLARLRSLHAALALLEQADRKLARSPRLLLRASLQQLFIFMFDALTVWSLVAGLGAHAPFPSVFASFMIASLFRTIGILPGGLGSFEASSVLTLKMIGVALPVALSATFLFRALSFWLPMLPGLWLSRRAVSTRGRRIRPATPRAYWSRPESELCAELGTSGAGLSSEQAAARLLDFGPNELRETQRLSRLRVLLNQARSPLLLLLLFAAGVSLIVGEWTDALIVLVIVCATVLIGYRREYTAQVAAAALVARIKTRATVLRDGEPVQLPVEELVPGDVVTLAAGSLVPADGVLLSATDCYVSEAVLTGESFPAEKRAQLLPAQTPLAKRSNTVYLGTNVRSGTARCLVVATGRATEFGAIAQHLSLRPPETEFDRGVRRFGYLLTSAMLVMVLLVFVAHVLMQRPPVETLLFSIALAVGLSPELLPAILSINLSRAARLMAEAGVLVRRLSAIENLGSIDVLCTDKTGTLTAGVVDVEAAYDASGAPSERVLTLGAINAALETGLPSPLDDAILMRHKPDLEHIQKRAEIPFDFMRGA